jgi:hypothetical protein
MHTNLQARAAHNSANTISMTQTLRALWPEGSRGMTAGIVPRICVRSVSRARAALVAWHVCDNANQGYSAACGTEGEHD